MQDIVSSIGLFCKRAFAKETYNFNRIGRRLDVVAIQIEAREFVQIPTHSHEHTYTNTRAHTHTAPDDFIRRRLDVVAVQVEAHQFAQVTDEVGQPRKRAVFEADVCVRASSFLMSIHIYVYTYINI